MEENKTTFQTIDEYILQFTPEVQEIFQTLRGVIKEAAPEAKEKISWAMPTFFLHGNLVHFAAFKNFMSSNFFLGKESNSIFLDYFA